MSDERSSKRLSPLFGPERPPYVFPEPGDYLIYSNAHFVISRDVEQEMVILPARMIVSISDVMHTEEGSRYVQVDMREWEAVGQTRLLDGEIRYVLVEGLESRVSAGSILTDLPGRMHLMGRFHTFFNGMLIDEHIGQAIGMISSFPPSPGDLFDISGSFVQFGDVRAQGVFCACAK